MKKVACVLTLLLSIIAHADSPGPKNVIFFIIDGMGPAQVEAASIFLGGKKLAFQKFPFQGLVTTCSQEGVSTNGTCDPHASTVTDSAAAATAMATGHKVKRRVLGKRIPGDGQDIPTIIEKMKAQGKATGVVTTELITDATPAGFTSHAKDRDDVSDILKQMLKTAPNVVMGADLPNFAAEFKKSAAQYQIAKSKTQLQNLRKKIAAGKLRCSKDGCPHIYAGFGSHSFYPGVLPVMWEGSFPFTIRGAEYYKKHDLPRLSDMTQVAIDLLGQSPNGFFLVIEGALPDLIGHINREMGKNGLPTAITALVHEMLEANKAVEIAAKWARGRADTLVVLTADHETGGLVLHKNKTKCLGKNGCVVDASWTSKTAPYEQYKIQYSEHTGVNVPIYAMGKNSSYFQGTMDNTQIVAKMNLVQKETMACGNSDPSPFGRCELPE